MRSGWLPLAAERRQGCGSMRGWQLPLGYRLRAPHARPTACAALLLLHPNAGRTLSAGSACLSPRSGATCCRRPSACSTCTGGARGGTWGRGSCQAARDGFAVLLAPACRLAALPALAPHPAFQPPRSHSIVHRDVKPANLLLSQEGGLLKVADLGVAGVLRRDACDRQQARGSSGPAPAGWEPQLAGRLLVVGGGARKLQLNAKDQPMARAAEPPEEGGTCPWAGLPLEGKAAAAPLTFRSKALPQAGAVWLSMLLTGPPLPRSPRCRRLVPPGSWPPRWRAASART